MTCTNPSHNWRGPVERFATPKHIGHIGDFACIPVIQIPVERFATKKHIGHIGDFACIPVIQIPVELFTTKKHCKHIGNVGSLPVGEVPVELFTLTKHPGHVGDVACIPFGEVLVELNTTKKHIGHILDTDEIGYPGECFEILTPFKMVSLGWGKFDLRTPSNARQTVSTFFMVKAKSVELARDGHMMLPRLFEMVSEDCFVAPVYRLPSRRQNHSPHSRHLVTQRHRQIHRRSCSRS